ncbi:hypothetical protein [Endozoicomonas sp. SESOKO2]|uniref:hypothetical protein n=1 Tax=Endozoicomonas sp. SESOKO2 TaxID=2828743 RepID=UPI002148791D|nr:hypothetical protein [Endozoicomonas sp. SESOKO2]
MIGLVDNDIFYKLTCCSLLDETLDYLRLDGHQVLDTFPHVLRKKTFKKNQCYGHDLPEVQNRLAEAFTRASRIPETPKDFTLLAKIASVPGIDPGEALMLCSAIETGSALLISGDKRFYSSLSKNSELLEICTSLEGRLICLEHLLLCLVDSYQFPYVLKRVVPAKRCDQVLRVAFSKDRESEEKTVTSILVDYSKEVVQGLGVLAYNHKPWYI